MSRYVYIPKSGVMASEFRSTSTGSRRPDGHRGLFSKFAVGEGRSGGEIRGCGCIATLSLWLWPGVSVCLSFASPWVGSEKHECWHHKSTKRSENWISSHPVPYGA